MPKCSLKDSARRARVTVEFGNLFTSAIISVLNGNQLPATTVKWSLAPTPAYSTLKVQQAEPTSESEADFFSIEWSTSAGTVIRALRSTGQQLWSAHSSVSSSPRTLKPWTRLPIGRTSLAGKPLDHVQRDTLQMDLPSLRIPGSRRSNFLLGKLSWLAPQWMIGGILLLEFGHSADTIVDLNGSDGSDDGTIRCWISQSRFTSTARRHRNRRNANTTAGTALLVFDGKTGLVRYRIPFPNSSTTV